jgi:hypothetical protein
MKLQRIYLDTSVFGGCFEPEFSPWSTGLLRDIENGLFQATTSEIIAIEIEAGAPVIVKEKFSRFLQICSPEIISASDEVLTLSDSFAEGDNDLWKRLMQWKWSEKSVITSTKKQKKCRELIC